LRVVPSSRQALFMRARLHAHAGDAEGLRNDLRLLDLAGVEISAPVERELNQTCRERMSRHRATDERHANND
jgi:hypothetical protein